MHKGKVVAREGKYKVIDCTVCGFKHLEPMPSDEDIKDFYEKKYFDLIKKGGKASEIRRLLKGGKEFVSELKWLKATFYKDINYILTKNISKKSRTLFDIGCGTGNFLEYMTNKDWETTGIEPSNEGMRVSKRSRLNVYNFSLEEFVARYPKYKNTFDVVTLLNVLEHVPDPRETLQNAKIFMKPYTGTICIRVPNDFNELQEQAQKKLRKKLWWFSVPDHINYFNFQSLQELLKSLNFEIFYLSTDFPMEFFLLTGDDYVKNPDVGSICHRKRVDFELLISDNLRRKIYHNLADMGIGRNCIIFAKVKK